MYDIIIIGMGVSGISAAIYANRAGLKVLMLEGYTPGGTLNKIPNIENYPGFLSITGPDLAFNLFDEVSKNSIEYKLETVTDVILEEIKTIKTKENIYQSKYLIIASGRKPKLLGLKKEEEYLGQGISTCALCDGPLFKNKDIAVVGGGSSALSEAIYLSKIAHKVYLIHRKEEFRGEDTLIEKAQTNSNIEIILNDEINNLIIEDKKITGVTLNSNRKINIVALFEYVGYIPNTDFLLNTALKMENGYILVNQNQETNIKGVYACGDVTKKEIYQIITAASEGAVAAINITKKH